MAATRPSLPVAVVMEREAQPNAWEDWRFRVAEVLVDEGLGATRLLRDDGTFTRVLHTGFAVELFADECEGYHLNLGTGKPVWFVMWRTDESDRSQARPEAVSLSYNEAGRWLDAQERVDNLPVADDVREWLQAFTDANYRPEPKKRKRPASFLPPQERPS